jgi:hypothetical protein
MIHNLRVCIQLADTLAGASLTLPDPIKPYKKRLPSNRLTLEHCGLKRPV